MGQGLGAPKQSERLPRGASTCYANSAMGAAQEAAGAAVKRAAGDRPVGSAFPAASSSSFSDRIARFLEVRLICTHFLTAVSVICHRDHHASLMGRTSSGQLWGGQSSLLGHTSCLRAKIKRFETPKGTSKMDGTSGQGRGIGI